VIDRPTVVFAYTIKGWRLPIEGHPGNHSALLTKRQWEQLATDLGADASDPWAGFASGSDEARLCGEAADRTRPGFAPPSRAAVAAPRPAAPPPQPSRPRALHPWPSRILLSACSVAGRPGSGKRIALRTCIRKTPRSTRTFTGAPPSRPRPRRSARAQSRTR
jgi:hypothetical protein